MQSKVTQLWGKKKKKKALNGRDTWVSTFWEFTLFKATRVDPWILQGLKHHLYSWKSTYNFPVGPLHPWFDIYRSNQPCLCSTVVIVQSLRHVQLFVTPWTAAWQASLYFTISCSLCKLMSIGSVMPSNHLIFCHSLLSSVFPSIRVFSNESTLCIRRSKYNPHISSWAQFKPVLFKGHLYLYIYIYI